MNKTQGFRDFDLPVDLHGWAQTPDQMRDIGHWLPDKSTDPAEIALLKKRKPGLLLARRQHTGTLLEARLLELLTDQDFDPMIMHLLGAAAFNSAYYSYAEGAEGVMRRRLKLPVVDNLGQITQANLTDQAAAAVRHAGVKTGHLATVLEITLGAGIPDTQKSIGSRLGAAALAIGMVPFALRLSDAWDQEEQQEVARISALYTREFAQNLDRTIGVIPSVAQFSQQFNLLTLPILQAKYGNVAKAALQQAQSEILDV